MIHDRPADEPGYTHRLKADLTWELVEVPVIPQDEQEISDAEALNIILGGVSE